ncbi:hypothetical protein BX661DRAFT_170040 [Kickxella alabastrina]|uniref:uncharacterized protein n=1 Tax=Kickxella alabastrina TaxID=61397 RepID=UPI00221F5206|nr:uncharacterized protein BX661DRAFT_170040 [Kickxella alabastrina]KAI7830839.1 hypothetical protein BX661DRAFT_170040 [Kickxella alabastrina]
MTMHYDKVHSSTWNRKNAVTGPVQQLTVGRYKFHSYIQVCFPDSTDADIFNALASVASDTPYSSDDQPAQHPTPTVRSISTSTIFVLLHIAEEIRQILISYKNSPRRKGNNPKKRELLRNMIL